MERKDRMRPSQVIRLATQYMVFGVVGALLTIFFLLLFWRKRQQKRPLTTKEIPWSVFGAAGILIGYLIIVAGATLVSRGRYEQSLAQLKFLETYEEAWYNADIAEWRDLILNIFMFIPIGFLFPFLRNYFKKWWVTYLGGFCLTFMIESTQFVLRCGVFQVDDLWNNLLGTMIGYSLFCLLHALKKRFIFRKKISWRLVLLMQMPILICVLAFLILFVSYQRKEFGNLSCENIKRHDNVEVIIEPKLVANQKENSVLLWKSQVYTRKEALFRAKSILQIAGFTLDKEDFEFYETQAVFRSFDRQAAIWINYQGGTFDYENYMQQWDSHGNPILLNENATRKTVEDALTQLNITVPSYASFEKQEDGYYRFATKDNGTLHAINGFLLCRYTVNDTISSLRYYMIKTTPYKKWQIHSSQWCISQLKKGRFYKIESGEQNQNKLEQKKQIRIHSIKLNFLPDSKGYYRPIFHCIGRCDGKDGWYIDIPAQK